MTRLICEADPEKDKAFEEEEEEVLGLEEGEEEEAGGEGTMFFCRATIEKSSLARVEESIATPVSAL